MKDIIQKEVKKYAINIYSNENHSKAFQQEINSEIENEAKEGPLLD